MRSTDSPTALRLLARCSTTSIRRRSPSIRNHGATRASTTPKYAAAAYRPRCHGWEEHMKRAVLSRRAGPPASKFNHVRRDGVWEGRTPSVGCAMLSGIAVGRHGPAPARRRRFALAVPTLQLGRGATPATLTDRPRFGSSAGVGARWPRAPHNAGSAGPSEPLRRHTASKDVGR
jgi:hypothetical protein